MAFVANKLIARPDLLKASDFCVTFKVKGQKAVHMAMRVEKSCYNALTETFHFQVRSRQTNGLYIFGVKNGVEITGASMGEPVQEA